MNDLSGFTRQVNATADRLCRAESTVGTRHRRMDACRTAIWEEVNEKLTPAQRSQLNAGRAAMATAPLGATPAT